MADFDAFDRMTRTLRGANPLPPQGPMASMAEQLRATPGAAPPPAVPAYDAEVTQRAQNMTAQRRAGATNATAGATQPPQPSSPKVGPSPGNPVGGGNSSVLGRAQAAVGAGSNPGIGQSFKSVAGGVGSGLRTAGGFAAGVVRSPYAAGAAGIAGAVDGFQTDTEQYAKRFGMESTAPGVLRDLGVRALGVASDVGNNLMLGAPEKLGWLRDKAGDPTSKFTQAMQEMRPGMVNGDNMGQPGAQPGAPATAAAQPAAASPTAFTPGQTGRNIRDIPGASGESLRGVMGDYSPTGTFSKEYTDIGGGIARNGNAYTNIGADGKPTAMSTRDSRTPDQIANAARINAETAKYVAQREQVNRVSPGQQFIADMERKSGLSFDNMLPSMRRHVLSHAAQLGNEDVALQRERIASGDRQMGHQVQREGHQVQLETAALPAKLQLQAAQQKRQAIGEALRMGGGDQRAAAQILNNAGFTDAGKDLMEQYSTGQTAAKNDVELGRNLTAASSIVKDDKGNDVISPARQAANESALRQMVANYDQLGPQEKVAAEKQYRPALNILSGMNDRREDTLFKKLGIDQAPLKTTLGDLQGAELGDVGPWEGWTTFDAQRGDYALRKGGRTQYINKDRMSEAEKAFLVSQGVNLRGVK